MLSGVTKLWLKSGPKCSPSANFLSGGGAADCSSSDPASRSNDVRVEVLAVVGVVPDSSVSLICEVSAIENEEQAVEGRRKTRGGERNRRRGLREL